MAQAPVSGADRPANRLAAATSPYLRQHAQNPVDWHSWGPEALDLARRLDRPILVSSGYAACHWCHVMAHESFEDETTATLMNRLFVNIKIDKEERPDLDYAFQHVLALLGVQGGWPLTLFLTPQAEPFWGGTYFPPDRRYGRPAFRDVLAAVSEHYRSRRTELGETVGKIRERLVALGENSPGDAARLDTALREKAARDLTRRVDPFFGGLTGAPKFPQATLFQFLARMRRTSAAGAAAFGEAVDRTLAGMAAGGLYDHLAGGFCRYSTDDEWLVPHFEKMLYDNGQLLELYALALVPLDRSSPRARLYRSRIEETIDWLRTEMLLPAGAFASSLDADSEGEEGKFYVWTRQEIRDLLGEDAEAFSEAYEVTARGNWEGHVILNHRADPLGLDHSRFAAARARLLQARAQRVRPGRDDKVLADWNAMAVCGLVAAGRVCGRPDWLQLARSVFAATLSLVMPDGGRLHHAWAEGRADHPATLDDLIGLARAALDLALSGVEPAGVTLAEELMALADRAYWDPASGGYFFSAAETRDVPVRAKIIHDNATPAANGQAVLVLLRLWQMTGRLAWRERMEAQIAAFAGSALEGAVLVPGLLMGVASAEADALLVIQSADGGDPAEAQALEAAALAAGDPWLTIWRVEGAPAVPPAHPLHGKTPREGRATAWLCRGMSCLPPLTDAAALTDSLVKA